MNFTFLAPLALLGSLLVAVPVVLHLIDRRRVPRIAFPPMRFLLVAQKRLKRHRRLRDPFLMLLRILALLALVFAFSSPLIQYQTHVPAGADLSPNVVFLLDNSMSMGYKVGESTLLEQAKARILDVVQRMPEGGRVGLVVFNREPDDVLGGVTPDIARLKDALERVKPTFEETNLRPALLSALRDLLATPEGGGDVYLLSDATEISLGGDGPISLPSQLEGRVRLVVTTLTSGDRSNRALQGVSAGRDGGEGGKVRIVGSVKSEGKHLDAEAPLDLSLQGQVVSRGFVRGGAGISDKVFTLPAQADSQGEGVLTLGPDALDADNRFFFRMSNRRDLQALVIDGAPGEYLTSAESFFVERALNPARASGSRVVPVVVGEGAVPRLDPRQYPVVFILNVGDPSVLAERLIRYVKAGGGLFIGLGNQVNIERYNRTLAELLPASMGEVKASSMDLTGEKPPALVYPEISHPIFQVFREAGASVFSTVSFYKMVPTSPTLKSDAEVLLKYTNGLPALLSRQVGDGRVLLFTSSLDRDWNDLPLKSVFLPLIQESTHYLAKNPTGEERAARFIVGQPVVLEVPDNSGALRVVTPTGQEVPLEVKGQGGSDKARLSRVVFRGADVPGHYHVIELKGDSGEKLARPELNFAVNVAARESDLTPMDPRKLTSMLPGLAVVIEGQSEVQGEVLVDRKRTLNHSLLWAFLAFLALEGVISALWHRFGSQARNQTSAEIEPGTEQPSGEAA